MKISRYIMIELIALAITAGTFSACNKNEMATQDNIKVQKFDPNLYGIEIDALIAEPYFTDYADVCIDFLEATIDFTQEEINRLNELMELMQYAASIPNVDLFWIYYDEYMRVYYRTDDPNYGKERIKTFRQVSVEFMGQMVDHYPAFKELSETQQIEVLTEAFSKVRKVQTDYCGMARFRAENAAMQTLGISIGVCAITTGATGIGFAICSGVAIGLYARDICNAEKEYKICIAS